MVFFVRALRLPFLAILVVTGAIAVAVYASQAEADPTSPMEYAEYRNERWHFSLAVPADMIVSEHEREGNGQTVQFTYPDSNRILLISAWPYSQIDLTLGREGTPSTTWDQPDHLEIVDVVRNDLSTILFQKNGVRYVVVALPEHEAWLTDILRTWTFTEWR